MYLLKKLKYITFISAAIAQLTACSGVKSGSKADRGYTPETPELTSELLTPELLWSIGRVGDAAVSPDGKDVAYTVNYTKIDENRSFRDIYITSSNGGEVKRLTDNRSNEHSLQWRPDGAKLGYLSSISGSTQLWEIDSNGDKCRQITDIEGGISGFKYSPDMKSILYTKPVKLDKDIHDIYPDMPLAEARIEDDLMYRHWDEWHNYEYSHIFISSYGESKIKSGFDIMKGEKFDSPVKPFGGVEQIAWSQDSKSVAYSCKKKIGKEYATSTNSEIFIYTVSSGETTNLTKGMMGYDMNPTFSPDGRYIAWESMERDGYEADKNRLFIQDLKTGEKRDLTEGWDQSIHGLSWSSDSKQIFGISDIHATDEIYSVSIDSREIKRVTDGIHNYQNVAPADGGLIAQRVSMSSPAELYRVDPTSGDATAITAVTKPVMDQLAMGNVEKRWIETTDNKQMLTWVIYPPNFDPNKKYPTLLYCQGGPQSTVSQFWSIRWNFQMMAAKGYIIVAPNRRGLPGFGQEWCEQISTNYGGQNIEDYLAAIDALAKEPYVDEDKLGAVGASYGGFSTYYLAGVHEKRFKAFISHCGIFNLEAMYTTTEEQFFVNWEMGGSYWDKENKVAQNSFENYSPHKFVQNWDTPILVIHGEKDFRIPYTQGMGAFNAAQLKGIPSRFLYLPNENHWVLKPQNGIVWQRVFFDWLDRYLK